VSALDISQEALMVARENADIHRTNIEWIQMDFLDQATWNDLPVYDVIISNPPYIPENEKGKLDKNVTDHEPLQALFVPDNQPLIFYEKIAEFAKNHLAEDGKIFIETHEDYAQQVADHFSAEGYNAVVKKDFYDKERMVKATRSL
jgi:release factor glutamine methyltransferase